MEIFVILSIDEVAWRQNLNLLQEIIITRIVGYLRAPLARSGYPGQDASLYNNPMVMICITVNALTLL